MNMNPNGKFRFLFVIVCFGALMHGVGFGDEPSSQPSGQEPNEGHTNSDRLADHVHGKQSAVDKEQADTMHTKLNDSGRAFEGNDQADITTLRRDRDRLKLKQYSTSNHPAEVRSDKIHVQRISLSNPGQTGWNRPGTKDEWTMNTKRQQSTIGAIVKIPLGDGFHRALSV